ncbi:alkaline phosphatase family protein [Hoyosella subflava]|uniref:sulfatase n=1 Tax=Hoyosella subflava TaxID=639313 RepID=UPI0003038BF8|nr:sulfatase [Hoyosella subflava]
MDRSQTVRHAGERTTRRRVPEWLLTTLAALLVFLALIAPPDIQHLTPLAILRIPVEGLLAAALLLVLPARPRRIVALALGSLLGLLTLLRIIQMAFSGIRGRQFDPVFDWPQLGNGVSLLEREIGLLGAFAVAGGAAVLAIAVVLVLALSVGRLARVATNHRRTTGRTVAGLAVIWLVCLTFSVQLAPSLPVASRSVVELAYQAGHQVRTSAENQRQFDAELSAADDTSVVGPLAALRGKDVVFAFVESYGRIALEDPEFAPTVKAVLDDGTRQLDAAGFGSRSGYLTSPVSGGDSWLAHATLQSGLRVANQYSFDKLVESDRLTLTSAFNTDWRTVAVMPANRGPWPAGDYYGFDQIYDEESLDIRSRTYFGFQAPDQYTLSFFQRTERERAGREPVMAEIALVTSHWPWHMIPYLRDWNDVGDGAVFDEPDAGQSASAQVVMLDNARMRDGYRRAIEYSLSTLVSYVQTYGDDDLVLFLLGDHQPPTYLIGENKGLDVPITIVTRDQAVLDQIADWGWETGLRPSPHAPVWPMESFRDRFLTAFSK